MRNCSLKVLLFSIFITFCNFVNLGCGLTISKKKNLAASNQQIHPPVLQPEVLDPNNPVRPIESILPTPLADINPKLNITALDQPFLYEAEVVWSKNLKNVLIFVNSKLIFKSTSNEIGEVSFEVKHNTNYKIQLFTVADSFKKNSYLLGDNINNLNLIAEWSIKTPLDIVLSTAVLNQLKDPAQITAHRIFIDKAVPVVTNGMNLLINTNELISNFGVLETFEENKKAPQDTIGRNGGSLTIKTNKANGEMTVFMRGENGGDGSVGPAILTRGTQGKPGKDGTSFTRFGTIFCSSAPETGGKGGIGGQGLKGNNGKGGGNSGVFSLEIEEKNSQLGVNVYKSYGIPGFPGLGGPGERGGVGGPPGTPAFGCAHSSATEGPEGDQGIRGPTGDTESIGIIQQECISKGEGFGRCSF